MQFKNKSRIKRRLHKRKSITFNQSGGAGLQNIITTYQFPNNTYNNAKKYIDLSHIKNDLQGLVSVYIDLEKAYKTKHEEVMILYKSYMDMYDMAKQNNNKPDISECKSKLMGINNTMLNNEK